MLKFRYFQLRLPCSFNELSRIIFKACANKLETEIKLTRKLNHQIALTASFTHYISTKTISPEGDIVTNSIPTIDTYSIKIFEENNTIFLSCADPPRGSKFIEEILSKILGTSDYFFEAVELEHSLIFNFVENFNSCKLVSAKIRDFYVYNNAVGRLEISSQDGLTDEIAPFLKGKHYTIDALTYNVSHLRSYGLIYFSRNGTIKLSDMLADFSIPLFEKILGNKLG